MYGTSTEQGSSQGLGTSMVNDLSAVECSGTSVSLLKPVSYRNLLSRVTATSEDTTSSLGTCPKCSEHRKAAYQSLEKKHRLASFSMHQMDNSMFKKTQLANHDCRVMETNRSPDSFLHKRYGYHPGATVHHHGSSCWSGAHVCSRSSILGHSHGGGAPVRWCSSRASSNVIPLEQSKPVQTGEIKKFLADNEFVFREGYTCLISTCPRHVRRKIRLSELDRLYINRTTGMCSLDIQCFLALFLMQP